MSSILTSKCVKRWWLPLSEWEWVVEFIFELMSMNIIPGYKWKLNRTKFHFLHLSVIQVEFHKLYKRKNYIHANVIIVREIAMKKCVSIRKLFLSFAWIIINGSGCKSSDYQICQIATQHSTNCVTDNFH